MALTVGGNFHVDKPPNEKPPGTPFSESLRSPLNICDKHGVSLTQRRGGGAIEPHPPRANTDTAFYPSVHRGGGDLRGESTQALSKVQWSNVSGAAPAQRTLTARAPDGIRVEWNSKVRPVYRSHVGTTSICQPVLQTSVFGCGCSGGESQTHAPRQSYSGR